MLAHMSSRLPLEARARLHAALADPVRLRLVDALLISDRAPLDLRRSAGVESNLLAHHLDVLEEAGMIERSRSSGDGRRRYVHLLPQRFASLAPHSQLELGPALFVCSANSARSQLAAALWTEMTGQPGQSAGTHPAAKVNGGAVAAARRAGLDLSSSSPHSIDDVDPLPPLVVTVCDRAHEELSPGDDWLHWSVPDPVPAGTAKAFDSALAELRTRIATLRELAVAS